MFRSRSYSLWAIAAAAMLALPGVAAAQGTRPTVAVLYFDNNSFGKDRGDFEGLGKGIADLLITDLASNSNMRVVERERIQNLITEQNLTKGKVISTETAIRLGKIIGAQYMITGGFMSNGKGDMVLTARAINVESSAITSPVKIQQKGDDVMGMIASLSSRVINEMKLPALRTGMAEPSAAKTDVGARARKDADEVQVAQAAKPTKLDLRTALLYSKALEEQDSGHPDKATELYRQVLAKFPDFPPAKANLQKISASGN